MHKRATNYKMRRVLFVIFCAMLLSGCSSTNREAKYDRMVRIKGSDTMVILMSALAESFMRVKKGARVSVTGGGTRAGIAAMINGTCDIVAASRDITGDELALAKKGGITPKQQVIAKDAVAIIVNQANPVDSLSLDQLRKIFTGVCKDWRDLGGEHANIIVYSRESSSGTFRFVQSDVLENMDFGRGSRFLSSNTSIVESVSQEDAAIGYVSYGHAKASGSVKVVSILPGSGSSTIAPTKQTLTDGTYPLHRDLVLYLSNDRKQVKDFAEFCLSPEGRSVVEEYGCVPITPAPESERSQVVAL